MIIVLIGDDSSEQVLWKIKSTEIITGAQGEL